MAWICLIIKTVTETPLTLKAIEELLDKKLKPLAEGQESLEEERKNIWKTINAILDEMKDVRNEIGSLRSEVKSDIQHAEKQIIAALYSMIKDKIIKLEKGGLSEKERQWAKNVLEETQKAIDPAEVMHIFDTLARRVDNLEHFKSGVLASGKQ